MFIYLFGVVASRWWEQRASDDNVEARRALVASLRVRVGGVVEHKESTCTHHRHRRHDHYAQHQQPHVIFVPSFLFLSGLFVFFLTKK